MRDWKHAIPNKTYAKEYVKYFRYRKDAMT